MSRSQLNLSNEQLALINILNTMYNDNTYQINQLNRTVASLNSTNNNIRNFLVQILNTRSRNVSQNTGQNYNTSNRNQTVNDFNRQRRNRIGTNNPSYIEAISDATSFPLNSLTDILDNSFDRDSDNIFRDFFAPVSVNPTDSQIAAATRTVFYRDIVSPMNDRCPISLEQFNDDDRVIVIRYCNHVFSRNAINNWFRTNCLCPVCRYDIRDFSSNAHTEFYDQNSAVDLSGNTTTTTNNTNINIPSQTTSLDINDTPHILDRSFHIYFDSSGNILSSNDNLNALSFLLNNLLSLNNNR